LTETGHRDHGKKDGTGPKGGFGLSRSLLATVSALALLSGAVAGAAAFGATRDGGQAATFSPPTVAAATSVPAFAAAVLPPDQGAHEEPASEVEATAFAEPTATASATATDPVTPTAASSVSATPTLGDAWSATPVPTTPVPASTLKPAAAVLAADIEADWGIDLVTEGQDWGPDAAAQLKNLAALAGALEALPAGVIAAATHNSHGTLAVLSNNDGRTLAGWQPYGDRAANFYATRDWDGQAGHDTSQIILQPGSDRMTIAHELLHAYQMRDVPSGEYGSALLSGEMQSFMEMAGWVQTVSDEELQSSMGGSWDEMGALFVYEGRELTYVSNTGETVEAYTPNPVEAFAVVGALYYAAPEGTERPDWPEYWAWFAANLG